MAGPDRSRRRIAMQRSSTAPADAKGDPRRQLIMIRLLMGVYWFDEALQASLKAQGWPPVTRTQSMLFANLSAGEHRPTRLAGNLGISRQSMSELIADLVKKGLIEVAPDPSDRRAQVVTFSGAAISLRDAAFTVLRELEEELRSRIGDAAYAALSVGLPSDWGPPAVVQAPAPAENDGDGA
jgi:DNA-binding MarR family transcriptional regulator